MLDALSGYGLLRHEHPLPNGRRPDIELTVTPAKGTPFMIVGDVVCVSDAGLDEQNPVGVLSDELYRLAGKMELNPNYFRYNVEGGRVGSYGDARIKLFLPGRGQLLELMQREVASWMKKVKSDPLQPDSLEFSDQEIEFSITYDPNKDCPGGGYLSYGVAASRDKNPLFLALKSKVKQLKQASSQAIRLIIACDGGCSLLSQSVQMNSPGTFSSREVAEDFLRQNSSIDAVLLVTVDATRPVLSNKTSYTMRYDLVIAPSNTRSPRMDTMAIASLKALLETATHCVPEPILNALNAAIRCGESDFGPDMIGGYIMSNGNISLSSRALQRLLAGEITADEFINSHGWNDISGPSNPFVRMMRSGRMINKIEVESTGQDDDWLKFSFGSIDSAIAPFQVPLPEPSIESNDT